MRGHGIIIAAAAALSATGAWAQAASTVVTQGSISVVDPVELSQTAPLAAAPVVQPAQGARAAVASGSYTVSGLGGETFSVTSPRVLQLKRQGGVEQVEFAFRPAPQTGQVNGAPGLPGRVSFNVDGAAAVTSATPGGLYMGEYGLTIAYP